MKLEGVVKAVSAVQSGTSKSGNAWQKIEAVLEYEAHEQYPKAIVFSVMNDKIAEFNLQTGGKYEVDVDFSAREYNGRYYMSASAWKAVRIDAGQTLPTLQSVPPTDAMGNDLPF